MKKPSSGLQHELFDTPFGPSGIAWTPRGIYRLTLPDGDAEATLARLTHGLPNSQLAGLSPELAAITARLTAYIGGRPEDLSDIALDMEALTPFQRRVYTIARSIPAGGTLTYGEIAAAAGSQGGARAAGQALARNPYPLIVPCHRILASGGEAGGFSAPGGLATKARLLAREGIRIAAPEWTARDQPIG